MSLVPQSSFSFLELPNYVIFNDDLEDVYYTIKPLNMTHSDGSWYTIINYNGGRFK